MHSAEQGWARKPGWLGGVAAAVIAYGLGYSAGGAKTAYSSYEECIVGSLPGVEGGVAQVEVMRACRGVTDREQE